jgi:hypothetical protein
MTDPFAEGDRQHDANVEDKLTRIAELRARQKQIGGIISIATGKERQDLLREGAQVSNERKELMKELGLWPPKP